MRGVGGSAEFYGVLIQYKALKMQGVERERGLDYSVRKEQMLDWINETQSLPSKGEFIIRSIKRRQEAEKSLIAVLFAAVLGLSICFYVAKMIM